MIGRWVETHPTFKAQAPSAHAGLRLLQQPLRQAVTTAFITTDFIATDFITAGRIDAAHVAHLTV